MGFEDKIKSYFTESASIKKNLSEDNNFIVLVGSVIELLQNCFKSGKKLLVAGNGGSAAEAQHIASEIVSGYKILNRKGYPAIALTTDSSILTAWSNDHSFDGVFARQVEALGQPGDIFIGISTSGNSKNIIEAVSKSRELGIKTVCFLGKGGGKLKDMADHSIIVPSDNVPRIQEVHMLLTHTICEEIERTVFAG